MVVGDGIVIAGPGHEAVDAADAVHHARGVVRMPWQGDQVVALLDEAIERGALVELAVIDDVLEPVRELRAHVVEVAKLAAVEERALDFPERPLRPRLVVGVSASNGHWTKLVVTRECEEARIVDGLIALPAEHDRLLAVVLALARAAVEPDERAVVSVHQRVQVIRLVESEVLPLARYKHVRQCLYHCRLASRELDLVGRPVALGHLAGSVVGRGQARCRPGGRAHRAHVPLHAGVTTIEALGAQHLEHALRGDVGELRHQLGDPRPPCVDLRGARRARRAWRDRDVLGVAALCVRREQRADGVAAHADGASDRAPRLALLREQGDLVRELRATAPRRGHAASAWAVTVPMTPSSARSTGDRRASASRITAYFTH